MYSIFQIMIWGLPAANAPDIVTHKVIHPYKETAQQFENVSKNHAQLQGVWTMTPNIVICDDIAPKNRVDQAIGFWKRMGYKFGSVINNRDSLACRNDEIGTIKIMLPDNHTDMGNNLAITTTSRILATNENIRADIVMHSFAVAKPLVLEHEIGHALGWAHTNQRGHIMNPEYEKLGHNTNGVRYSSYISNGDLLLIAD